MSRRRLAPSRLAPSRLALALRVAIAVVAFGACTTSAARFEASGTGDPIDEPAGVGGGSGGGASGGADAVAHPTTVVGVRYRLAWDLAGAELDASGVGWSIVNDRGYRFAVTRATLVSHDVSLVPCPDATSGTGGAGGASDGGAGGGGEGGAASIGLGPWRLRFGPPSALANHLQEDDPSRVEAKVHEDLARPEPVSFGARDLFSTTYCEAHYLVAGQPADPSDPDGVDEATLEIEGTWRDEAGAATVETGFTIRVTSANGALIPLPGPPYGEAVDDGGIADVTLTRSIDSLFDEIDPSDGLDDADQRRVLSNLVDGTRLALAF